MAIWSPRQLPDWLPPVGRRPPSSVSRRILTFAGPQPPEQISQRRPMHLLTVRLALVSRCAYSPLGSYPRRRSEPKWRTDTYHPPPRSYGREGRPRVGRPVTPFV